MTLVRRQRVAVALWLPLYCIGYCCFCVAYWKETHTTPHSFFFAFVVEAAVAYHNNPNSYHRNNQNHHHHQQHNKIPDASSTLLKLHRRYTRQPPHDISLYHVLGVSPNATAAEITKSYRRLSRQFHPDKRRKRRQQQQQQQQQLQTTTRKQNQQERQHEKDVEGDDDEGEESNVEMDSDAQMLQQIRDAYEVLKDDSTRLPYHLYGLLNTNVAAFLLTGGKYSTAEAANLSPRQCDLLRLMGYNYHSLDATTTTDNNNKKQKQHNHANSHHDRVLFLATQLVERLRPWMEGTITTSLLADAVATECDHLKHLPLGAQILRCIGRAYRHAGRKVLRRYETTTKAAATISMSETKQSKRPQQQQQQQQPRPWGLLRPLPPPPIHHHRLLFLPVEEKVRDGLRHAKHVMTAAVASGRVVLSERIIAMAAPPSGTSSSKSDVMVEFPHWNDESLLGGPLMDHDDDDDDDTMMMMMDVPSQEEIQETERRKAQTVMLQALQVEALWKISKIDLDRTIQEACELMLSGNYFFFPSHQVPPPPPPPPILPHHGVPPPPPPPPPRNAKRTQQNRHDSYDGWVGAAGTTIDARIGKIRAAEALVLIGDVMVRCSKQGTAWME